MIEPTLYIIMRSDIPHMNPGKAIAQGSHATCDFEDCIKFESGKIFDDYLLWRENRTFGRTIVLEADLDTMLKIVSKFYFSSIVTDPEYPYTNFYGEKFTRKETTCAWVFVNNQYDSDIIEEIKKMNLHR